MMVTKKVKKNFFSKLLSYKKTIGVLILLFVLYILFFSGGSNPDSTDLAVAKRVDYTNTAIISGVVESNKDIEISFDSGGTVSSVLVKDGDFVKKGSLIATLESTELQSMRREKVASIEELEIGLEKLKRGPSDAQKLSILAATQTAKQTFENNYDSSISTILSVSTNLLLTIRNDVDPFFSNPRVSPSLNFEVSSVSTRQQLVDGKLDMEKTLDKINTLVKEASSLTSSANKEEDAQKLNALFDKFIMEFRNMHSSLTFLFDELNKTISSSNAESVQSGKTVGNVLKDVTGHLTSLIAKKNELSSAIKAFEAARIEEKKSLEVDPKEVQSREAGLRAAKESLIRINEDVANTRLVSPFSGLITDISVKEEEKASAGKKVARLADNTSLFVEANAGQNELNFIKNGDSVTIEIDALSLKTGGEVTVVNEVQKLVNDVPVYTVTVDFNDEIENLKIGLLADVVFQQEEIKGALAVPTSSILRNKGKGYVFVYDGEGVNKVEVEVGRLLGGNTEILSGITEGQQVLANVIE